MTMKIKNVDGSLHKTMVAAFRKQGLSESAATAKAAQHLVAARAKFAEAQTGSVKSEPVADRSDVRARLAGKKAAARMSGGGRKTGPSIKTASKKVTSAEQVALRKVSSPPGSRSFLMAKTSASVAIALGSVATWAKKLP